MSFEQAVLLRTEEIDRKEARTARNQARIYPIVQEARKEGI